MEDVMDGPAVSQDAFDALYDSTAASWWMSESVGLLLL